MGVFFLRAVTQQAKENERSASKMYELYDEMKTSVQVATKSRYAALIIFNKPVFKVSSLENEGIVPTASAHKIAQQLVDAKLVRLVRPGKGRRPGLYVFPRLMNLAEGREIFKDA